MIAGYVCAQKSSSCIRCHSGYRGLIRQALREKRGTIIPLREFDALVWREFFSREFHEIDRRLTRLHRRFRWTELWSDSAISREAFPGIVRITIGLPPGELQFSPHH